MEPKVISKPGLIKITDQESGYILWMDDKHTSIRIPSPIYDKNSIAITSRPIIEYRIEQPFFPDPKKQYCEIGPGLGEYIPFLVKQFEKFPNAVKPIAIDLVDYDNLIEIMNYAVDEGFTTSESVEREINTLIERAKIITDPEKVRLINKPLGQALKDHPELLGTVDDVVDNMAAVFHSDISEGIKMERMERLRDFLLKPELIAYR
ncbi:hypothetical protein HON71_03760 [Candidatus Woesearchaeota archaeon]|jgi:hypothetical protein|nr:hypothetical protein [Candidatus Woesearchaeota archaeon]MBT5342883.1 hypothetical protein [Candidatus Woesearchaeota archaeon]